MSRTVFAALIVVACLSTGCGRRPRVAPPVVATRIASQLECPAAWISVDAVDASPGERARQTGYGAGTWYARGCGRWGTFACVQVPWLGLRCEPSGWRARATPRHR
jgi:hypothetical protein